MLSSNIFTVKSTCFYKKGVIGPYEGAKPRAVLISRQQWLEMNSMSDE